MYINKLDRNQSTHEYDILCHRLYPWKDVVVPPFGSLWGIIESGKISKPHNHHERETFFITRGKGIMTIDHENTKVQAGDVIYIPAFTNHFLTNTSNSEELHFLTVWWEDKEVLNQSPKLGLNSISTNRVLITATPPTPNGDLHLGHLSGPYIGGDIYKRYLKMKGTDAYYISGADDHQSYVPLKGEQVGLSPRYTADQFTEAMIQTLTSANVEMDLFVRPTSSPYHIQLVQKFFEKLYIEGKLIVKEVPSLYCEDCEKYLFEAHIRGKCPYCGAGSDGNACEQCGKPNDCVELVDPICKYCSTPPSTRPFTRLYFPLSKYEQQLRDYYKSVHMNAHLRSLCEKMLQEGLPDIPISHVSDWGIQVPVKGFENQRIYVWFEMAPGYLAATQQLNDVIGVPQHWQNFWKSSEAEVVQFFGFDNGYFHAVLFPAMFLAYDSEITLPKTFVTNEFLQLEGMKFSTSRGHAIWGQQFMKQVPVDIARFYLSYHRPETEQTNFSITDFKETVQRELFDGWQEWLKELGIKLSLEYNGKAPELGIWMEEHKHYYRKLSSLLKEACISYDAVTFSPQQITRLLSELVRVTRRFAKAEDHLSGLSFRQDERRTSVALELVAAKMLAILSAPIMPNFSSRLWKDLGYDLSVFSNTWTETPSFIPGGQKISNMDVPYFQEITYEEGNVKVTT